MNNIFNAAELVEMGIEKERMRRDFYALASKTFKAPDVSKLFSDLSSWEEEHIKRFTEIGKEITDIEVSEEFAGEFAEYMRSLIDDLIYKKCAGSNFLKNVQTPLDAVQYGIGFEKDAIIFFRELLDHMSGPGKDIVSKLIDEEKKHIVYLTELKRKIITKGDLA